MINFRVLASGSKGNSVVITVDGVNILLDVGLTYKELNRRLELCGYWIPGIEAIFCSHEHGDHIKAVDMISKKNFTDTFANCLPHVNRNCLVHGEPIGIANAMFVTPVKMDHDVECFGFTVSDGAGNKIGYITDTYTMPCDSLKYFMDCQALIIEFNHDTELVIVGPYPEFLQVRALETHMENTKAADLVNILAWEGLKFVVCHHISEKNNDVALIRHEAETALKGFNCEVIIADQKIPTKLMTII